MTTRELPRHRGLLTILGAIFVLLVVQSIAVAGFTAAGLRERSRLAAPAAEHAA
jgi:hypothetical protein